eukprot:CAMPEP_0184874378 /NCGR_PEP_ID=MMETSP0580-20130426/42363_1 /TAXON_ID=1118495 /ORGANISM="Dactyliosolen fragilissimus" /LENGTH=485 /DNA_ID=CAMNT_0027377387 /DNA_START=3134 /DNA_END=4592 /DNA_ORIENTATION=+
MTEKTFDPLEPLQHYITSNCSQTVASDLSPLSFSLGVPVGYIHARVLIERMKFANKSGAQRPNFETEVLPVIKKLKSSSDSTKFAEWCSSQYCENSTERLECLQIGLALAIRASNIAENQRIGNYKQEDKTLEENETRALETVKRISALKSALSDKLSVKNILDTDKNEFAASSFTNMIYSDVIDKAQTENNVHGYLSPEVFVENLLLQGSLLAAEGCLKNEHSFTMNEFRIFSFSIHKACTSLAGQYSHINFGKISRNLVRRWLIHGDEVCSSKETKMKYSTSKSKIDLEKDVVGLNDSVNIDEEDTANFVLDLKTIATGNSVWLDDVGPNKMDVSNDVKNITSHEEPSSAFRFDERESSEYRNARVGLRISFVMYFNSQFYLEENIIDIENNIENIPVDLNSGQARKELSHNLEKETLQIKKDSQELCTQHARYFLKIVFAKSDKTFFKGESTVSSKTMEKSSAKAYGLLQVVIMTLIPGSIP